MTEASRRARKTLLRKHLTREGVVTESLGPVKFEVGNDDGREE
ncbi:MAG: hypothetical protein ACFFFO_17510 [Candidatus Thorarchaeota archaeon]